MRAGRRGVFVSIIAVTNGSEKTKKTKFLRQVRIVFSFRTDGRDGGRQYANCVRRANNNTERIGEGIK
jgi:hypothetical protein